MVRIGIIGIGFMGKTHWHAAQQVTGGAVTAICTRSEKKLAGDWSHIQGNFGGPGGQVDLSEIKKYRSVDEILADPDIDIVDICLPTALHRQTTIAAFEAGKHVLLEKPIAVQLDDADAMVAAANASGRKFFVGQVLRFWPEFDFIKRTLDSGEYGALKGANFKRIISAPAWGGNSYTNLAQSGGPGIDLHIHDSDFINYILGVPDSVYSSGILVDGKHAQFIATHYAYEELGVTVTCQSGAMGHSGRPFEHGFDIYFENGTIQYNSTWGSPLCVVTKDGVTEPELSEQDGFVREIQYTVDTVANDTEPTLLSGQSARDSLELCWREVESIQTGSVVRLK